ncbi:MAG: hypothetical protein H7A37_05770 [Chlamydiales bacterium]|nr:hypothetical protein [Chlamydiales bacterium]
MTWFPRDCFVTISYQEDLDASPGREALDLRVVGDSNNRSADHEPGYT